jgi:hypothetical protein
MLAELPCFLRATSRKICEPGFGGKRIPHSESQYAGRFHPAKNSVAVSQFLHSFQTGESFFPSESGTPEISISELLAAMNSDALP